jgi:hypothetical protein
MNPKPTPERLAYRKRQLDELDKVLPNLAAEIPEQDAERLSQQQVLAKVEQTKRQSQFPLEKRPPEKLPDPWLFDSEALLRELDRCRELVLQISIANPHQTHFDINTAVDALWNLRETLRNLLALHREGQRSFARRTVAETQKTYSTEKHAVGLNIRAQ